jgi:uncharacterized 2Fe-2S/4Fe-4S cluster protein (DUF4445 family)
MTDQVRVTFEPHGRAVFVLAGSSVLEAAGRAGLTIDTPCGGTGTCGKCRVQITRGAATPGDADRRLFSDAQLADGWRLACQTTVHAETVVTVPESSLFGGAHQILSARSESGPVEIKSAVRKQYVELAEPTLAENVPDLLRLEHAIGPFKLDLRLARAVPHALRANGFKGTAVLSDHHLLDFESGDTTGACFGAAFDIGTTTMVGVLLDLCTGAQCAMASRMNPQVSYGDDVLSRIRHSESCPDCLEELQQVVISDVAEMIAELCESANVRAEHIYEVSFAGNTTMEHLLCGIDPSQLGQIPFVPVHARGLLFEAGELGLPINPRGMAYVFPVIGGFVGGDTVAGILSTQLLTRPGPVLMVDIGTNGEIVLAHNGNVWAASTAAGPAFEGARISCGMRATAGAIEKIVLGDDVSISVIGNCPPIGICGSGIIDAVAQLVRHGIVTPEGRLLPPDELPGDLAPALAARVHVGEQGGVAFVLADHAQASVTITQKDIREVQLAGGALRAGIRLLLRQAGVAPEDVHELLIAGGFGSFIRRTNAQQIGVLPHEIDKHRIKYVGNVALGGAIWALLSSDARRQAEDEARMVIHVELSTSPEFQMEFAEGMIFPAVQGSAPGGVQ